MVEIDEDYWIKEYEKCKGSKEYFYMNYINIPNQEKPNPITDRDRDFFKRIEELKDYKGIIHLKRIR